MKHVRVSILVPGMITAQDVLSSANQLILPRGLVLTDKAIARLESYDIKTIRIEDPVDMEVEEVPEEDETIEEAKPIDQSLVNDNSADNILDALNGLLSQASASDIEVKEQEEPSHFEKIQSSEEFKEFKEDFEENVSELKNQINDIVEKNTPIDVSNMLGPTMDLLSTQKSSFGVFDMLHNMRQYDDLTSAHSMNVALICNVFAQWLNLSPEEIELATACGMFHDIGKLKIDDAIIKKPGKLTDEEYKIIKSHPVEGYKILQHQQINEHIKNAALMHHEKCDGTGYPLMVKTDKIDPYARIVAIADVYDAMTSARCYRGALCPFTVIEMFEREGLQKYDVVYIMTFLENVINTYIDNKVQLSDGRVATVKWIDKKILSRPMVMLEDGSFIELSKYKDLKIIKIL